MVFTVVTILFAIALFVTGLFTIRWIKGVAGFNVAGREIGIYVGIAGIAAMGVAGQMIVMQSGFTVSFGYLSSLSNVLPYAIGIIVYGFIFSPVVRRSGAQTVPEYIEMRFGSKCRLLVVITQLLGLTGVVALSTVAMANITLGLLGWPWFLGITVFFLMYLVFVVSGGFWSVSLTDFWQLILAAVTLPAVSIYLLTRFGGWSFLVDSWPHNFWTTGYAGGKMSLFALTHPSYFTVGWTFLAITWGSSYFWMRGAANRDERTAKISYIGGGILLLILAPIAYGIYGGFAAALNPGVFQPLGALSPDTAIGVLMKTMPYVVTIPLYIAILAASISTGSTALIAASVSIQQDILGATKWSKSVLASRILVILVLIGIWLLCWYPASIVYLFGYAFAWFIPSFFAILFGIFWKKTTNTAAFVGVIVSAGFMAFLQLAELTGVFKTWHIAHPAMFGTVISILLIVIISYFTKPKYFGEPHWEAQPSEQELRSEVTIHVGELESKILNLIDAGYNTTTELLDLIGKETFVINEAIEKLDEDRLIERKALSGANFHNYAVTKKGEPFLSSKTEQEKGLAKYGLDKMSLKMLHLASQDPLKYAANFNELGYSFPEAQVVVTRLVKLKYVKDGGALLRKITVTNKGKEVLRQLNPAT
jgi:SSS family solute:Na+ symporter